MLAIVAAVLFAIALIFGLVGIVIGPLDIITLMAAGLVCLALQLAGVGAGSLRRSRV